jgi:DNA invertase Pin-like site-specific DNA recombinase
MPTTVGYARCSTDSQDLTAQRSQLTALGVAEDRIYMDKGISGTRRDRPGLDQALAAVREGDTFVVTKLDRLARSVPDALEILEKLSDRGVKFSMGGSVYNWDAYGKMFLTILATIAEFEGALIRQRTREGMAIARANGKLRGRGPKLSPLRQKALLKMYADGGNSIVDLAETFEVSRPTVYRVIARSLTNAGGSPAGLDDRRPSRPRRATVPGGLPRSLPPTGPDEPEVLSTQQEASNPPQLLVVDVPGDHVMNVMSVDGVRDQGTPKGANLPSDVRGGLGGLAEYERQEVPERPNQPRCERITP